AFHLRAQRNAFRRRDAGLQSRLCPRQSTAETQPHDQPDALSLSAITARYNSLVEIPSIAIFLAERRNMVLRCFQDGFLAHVHKYLGFPVTDPVDMLR